MSLYTLLKLDYRGYVSLVVKHFQFLSIFMTYHQICNQSYTTDATSGAGTAYHSGAPKTTPGFQRGSCCSMFSFLCSVLQIAVCPIVPFHLATVLSVLLRFTDCDYRLGIFKIFFPQNTTQKTKNPLKTRDELSSSGRVSSYNSTCGTCRVPLVINQVVIHE